MSDFLHMGGYATYVWGSYGVALLVFAWNVAVPRLGRRDVLRRLKAAAMRPGEAA